MNKSKCLRWPIIFALLTVLPLAVAHGAEVLKADVEKVLELSQGGQSNPFAPVLKKQRISTPQTDAAAPRERESEYDLSPELFLETVDLQFMNPQEASAAFSCMSSEMGQVVAQEGSNRVIVFDTRENLQRIVGAIKEADQPIQALSVKAIDLQHIEAKVAASVMSELASGAGSIVVADKTNTLILCDTKSAVEAMEKELLALDRPTPGLLVVTVTLQHMDAESGQAALENLLSESGSIALIKRTNTLVISDLAKNVSLIQEEIKKIDKEMSGLIIETVALKFLTAENLKPILDTMVSQYGVVATNAQTNSVILCDTAENMGRILTEIRKVDKTPKQIMVEVVMMDVRLGDDQEIGINWDLMSHNNFYDYTYRQNVSPNRLGSTAATAGSLANATAYNSVGALGGDFSVISGNVRNVVHLVQQKRDVEIIASPRALVMSGKTATVQAIEEIPYELLSTFQEGGSMSTTEFKPVGITLDVTANLTESGEIALDITIDLNVRTSESSGGVPVVDTRGASTTLLLHDGQIVVMGGLRRNEKTTQVTQIPLLGDIPFIGNLFKSTTELNENSELVILISPHVYAGEAVPEDVARKYENLKESAPLTGPSGSAAKARERAEAKAKAIAEAEAQAEAEAKVRAEAKAQAEVEAKVRAEAEAKVQARARVEAKAQAEAEAKVRADAEAKAKARARAEAKAQAEAKTRARAEAKTRARAESKAQAEAKAKARAEAKAQAEAEAKAQTRAKKEKQTMTVSVLTDG
jgi:type II secretory pathway component GspD/PulD (secretin)